MASLFANCCGSRSRVPHDYLVEISEEAKAARSSFADDELQRFDGNWSHFSDKTNMYMHSDKLSELTGMPGPMADIFVAAFTAYGATEKDIDQVGLSKHDLMLVVETMCKSGSDEKRAFCLFRFFVANRFHGNFEDMKFRMIFPLMLCSLLYLDACAVDKKNTSRNFQDFKTDAESMGALANTLIGDQAEIHIHTFADWIQSSALGLLDLLAVPLSRTFVKDEVVPPLIPASAGRELMGFSSTTKTFLTVEQMWCLSAFMPEHKKGAWEQVYSSDNQSTFGQMLETVRGLGAFVVLIKDDTGAVFGGFTSRSLPKEEGYFADEDSMVFQLLPSTRVFRHQGTHDNAVYYGVEDGLGMGGEKGSMALFIHKSMDTGHSYGTETFGNEDSISPFEEFDVQQIEVWSCIPS